MALCRLRDQDDGCPHCPSDSPSAPLSSISLPQSYNILSSLQHDHASPFSTSSFLSADTCPSSLSDEEEEEEVTANAMDGFSGFTLSLGSQDESCSQLCGTESPCPQCVAEAHLTKPSAVCTNKLRESHLSRTSGFQVSSSDEARFRKQSGPSGMLLGKDAQLGQGQLCKSNDVVVVQANSSETRSSERGDVVDEVKLPSRTMEAEVKHFAYPETDTEGPLMPASRCNIMPAAVSSNSRLVTVVRTEQDNQKLSGKENINQAEICYDQRTGFIKKAELVAKQKDVTGNASAKRKVGCAVADGMGWLCPRDGKKNFNKPKPRQSLLDVWLRKQR